MTTDIQTIPLNKLFHSEANVRHTGKADDIEGLAASIAAHGLRQNLNVLPSADGKRFAVVAGGRRLRALKHLAKTGQLPKDAPISCLVLAESDDPAEISLVENAMREAMHPDDQCAAFADLIGKGSTAEEVAARFGVTPAVVRQRLKLAGVSPKLRSLYRKGEITLDQMTALAISDDHAAQEAAWADLPDWNRNPAALKRALTGGTVAADDRLARFVTVEAYIDAGGSVIRDLFDAEDEGYLADAALVQRLAAEKMEAACAAISAEGWQWVEARMTRDYSTSYERVWPQGNDSEDEDESAAAFDPADIARAGVLITLAHDGSLQVERGLVHPDDHRAEAKAARPAAEPGALAAALVTDLSAHRTAALRVELAGKPSVALAAVVHAMALPLLYGQQRGSCLDLRAVSAPLDRLTKAEADSPAHDALRQTGTFWGDRLPGSPADLFAWCLSQDQSVLLDLLAFVAGLTVDAVESKGAGRNPAADALAQAVTLDMREWWQPTVEGFWQRLPKAGMIHAMGEAKVTAVAPLDSVKKAEAAHMVAKAMQGGGWLPAPLREMAA